MNAIAPPVTRGASRGGWRRSMTRSCWRMSAGCWAPCSGARASGIVRGIAAGDVRHFCEAREGMLRVRPQPLQLDGHTLVHDYISCTLAAKHT